MSMRCNSKLQMAATHLNASIGAVVEPEHIVSALQAGSLDALSHAPRAEAMVAYLFIELEPRLVCHCVQEAGATLAHAQSLYESTLQHDIPRSPAWESEMGLYA